MDWAEHARQADDTSWHQLRDSAEAVILGGGIAGSATAIALLNAGIRPLLLVRPNRGIRMTEVIPASTMQLFDALRVSELACQSAVIGHGLDNRWNPNTPVFRDEPFLVFDRLVLADSMLREARRRGANVEKVVGIPSVRNQRDRVIVALAGKTQKFPVAIDASGRAAAWSRPVSRVRHLAADVFQAEATNSHITLKLVRSKDGWAYLVNLRERATVVLLSPPSRPQVILPDELADELHLRKASIQWTGRRAAYVQAPANVVTGRVLAVGDAAFAHDPVAGQGVRFALASALAAAAVIATCRRSENDRELATVFYEEFVRTECNRHCSFLHSLYEGRPDFVAVGGQATAAPPIARAREMNLGRPVCFAGRVEPAPLHIGGYIERGEVLRLSDGGAVRWLGGFDLLRLCDLARQPTAIPKLVAMMASDRIHTEQQCLAVIQWCYDRKILAELQEIPSCKA